MLRLWFLATFHSTEYKANHYGTAFLGLEVNVLRSHYTWQVSFTQTMTRKHPITAIGVVSLGNHPDLFIKSEKSGRLKQELK